MGWNLLRMDLSHLRASAFPATEHRADRCPPSTSSNINRHIRGSFLAAGELYLYDSVIEYAHWAISSACVHQQCQHPEIHDFQQVFRPIEC
jgi:hypothetical protein